MLLEIKDLRKSFGGLYATDGVNLTVSEGEVCALIGPNGAGKTTLFNLISGYLRPDSGKVIFREQDITCKPVWYIVREGIARSFQIVNVFPRLTVYENMMVGVFAYERRTFDLSTSGKACFKDECMRLLESVALADSAKVMAGQLAHGKQKRLEVGLALASKPKLLLLDEPTAGMASEEKFEILDTVREAAKKQGSTIFLTGHDMSVIFSISDIIWVLHNGRIVAKGTVDQIRNNELVRKIYLGQKG